MPPRSLCFPSRRLVGLITFAILSAAGYGQQPLQPGLHAWFKSDAGVVTTDANVTGWTDQTSNGFVLSPPGAASPVLSDASVNGLPAVRFAGTQQLNGNLGGGTLSGATVFSLFRYAVEDSDNDYLYTMGTASGSGSQFSLSRRSDDRAYHYDGSVQRLSAGGLFPANRWHVSSQVFGARGAASHDLFLNGAAILRTDANNDYLIQAGTFVLGNFTSGSTRFIGDVAEFLVYERVLSEAERRSVEEYLRLRGGLPPNFGAEAEILSGWQVVQYEFNAQPDANWIFDLGGTRADQSVNSDASILLSDIDVSDRVIWGKFGSGTAPDFMGFVFGYQDRGHYYLFDWKKVAASYQSFGTAPAGMRLKAYHVDGEDPGGREFWAADNAAKVTVLRENDIAWTGGVDYDFSLRFTPGAFVIRVWQGDTVLETWKVEDERYTSGKFGYFVNSLQDVRFGEVIHHPIAPLQLRGFARQGESPSDPFLMRWIGSEPPYQVESSGNLLNPWEPLPGILWSREMVVPMIGERRFYRVRSLGQQLTTAP